MPIDEKLGVGRTTKLALLIGVLLMCVSIPISIVAVAEGHEPPKVDTIPLQQRPDYKAGFQAGAALIQARYDTRDQMLSHGSLLCNYAKLVCQEGK